MERTPRVVQVGRVAVALAASGMLGLLAVPRLAFADRADDLAKKANTFQREVCEDVADFQSCHDSYEAGCSDKPNAVYEPYLNFLKNQVPPPDLPPVRLLTQADVKQLDQQIPSTLKKGKHAKYAADLAQLGEGNIYGVIGYLYYAKVTKGPETTNCKLTGTKNSDFHLGVGFDPALAQKVRDGQPVDETDLEQQSIVVEMTPHYRAEHHKKWTTKRVGGVKGRQVKVVGQLAIDTEHIGYKDNCAHPNADMDQCWRASAWEVHPVIQFYVCDSEAPCSDESSNWKAVDALP